MYRFQRARWWLVIFSVRITDGVLTSKVSVLPCPVFVALHNIKVAVRQTGIVASKMDWCGFMRAVERQMMTRDLRG
jgi:hypothetical protein